MNNNRIAMFILAGLLTVPFFFYNKWQDVDYWGHLFFGRKTLETRRIQRTDIYSYTALGREWTNHEWLGEVAFYSVYNRAAEKGLIFFKLLIGFVTGIFLFATLMLYSKNYKIVFSIYLLAMSLVYAGASFRPHLFTYLLLSACLFLVHLYIKNKNELFLWCLIPVMILWANLHGGFVAGIILIAVLLFGERFKRYYYFMIVLILSSLITPYGVKLWKALFVALTNPLTSQYITEWMPFNPDDFSWLGYVYLFYIVLCAVSALSCLRYGRYACFIAVLSGIIFALKSARHIPLLAIIASPFIMIYFEKLKNKHIASALIFSAYPQFFLIVFLSLSNPSARIEAGNKFPSGAVNFIKENKISGNIFNEFNWGEYVIWHLNESCKVAIDGRYDTVYPVEYLGNYFEKGEIPPNTDYLLVKPVRKIDEKLWKVSYKDDNAVIYSRKLDETKKNR
ncbi:MAG: hypothetical protein BWY26_00180 [Elusimicrobia bacterium ADurb.Bin231]|nr:MAG: hypothetical protein BWY26_00180 [Elusimicrobia bacterium ADurb.Bin231]